MRPERRRSKISRKQILIYVIIVVGTLILLGLLFWIFKPFSEIEDMNGIYVYHYKVY